MMELDVPGSSGSSRKRTVDADNPDSEVVDPKRPRINLDNLTKGKILRYIVSSGMALYNNLKLCNELKNITLSHQIMSILQGGHNILRKMTNFKMSTHPNLNLTATVTLKSQTHNLTYKVVTDIMREQAEAVGLTYTQSNRSDNNHWYGIANPLFNILSAFKMRYDEIRVGVSRIPVGKRGNTTDYVDIAQYGLTPAHHVLLEGSTYKPERRSAMAQTLGPLTAVIAAYKSRDPYRNKWMEAVKRDLVHIPKAINLCNAMQGKRAEEVAPALSACADVVLIAGSRNAQRAFFPLNFIIYVLGDGQQLESCGIKKASPPLTYTDIDFSRKGMWLIYKECSRRTWNLETAMDDIAAGQVVYHAIFGTQNEDLGILQSITDVKSPWKLKSEIADFSEGKSSKNIKLPQQRLYSKLAQANMTGLLTESAFQIRCMQVFAGKRTINNNEAFYKHMSSDSP